MNKAYDKQLREALQGIRTHTDELYKLVASSNPDASLRRHTTEQDKRLASACWHGHEVSKYLMRMWSYLDTLEVIEESK